MFYKTGCWFRAVVLNTWVMTPLGTDDPFTGGTYQIFTLWFITVTKLQLWSSIENNFTVGHHHNTRDTALRTLRTTALEAFLRSGVKGHADAKAPGAWNQHLGLGVTPVSVPWCPRWEIPKQVRWFQSNCKQNYLKYTWHEDPSFNFQVWKKKDESYAKYRVPRGTPHFVLNMNPSSSFAHCLFPTTGSESGGYM